MTHLPIHITTHHLSLSDSLGRFARKKIGPVTRFAHDAIAAEIVLRRHNGAETRFSASARLALPGRDVHGRAVDRNLYVARKTRRQARSSPAQTEDAARQKIRKT